MNKDDVWRRSRRSSREKRVALQVHMQGGGEMARRQKGDGVRIHLAQCARQVWMGVRRRRGNFGTGGKLGSGWLRGDGVLREPVRLEEGWVDGGIGGGHLNPAICCSLKEGRKRLGYDDGGGKVGRGCVALCVRAAMCVCV